MNVLISSESLIKNKKLTASAWGALHIFDFLQKLLRSNVWSHINIQRSKLEDIQHLEELKSRFLRAIQYTFPISVHSLSFSTTFLCHLSSACLKCLSRLAEYFQPDPIASQSLV